MRVHYQCQSRGKRHEARQMTPGNEHLKVGMHRLEGALYYSMGHSATFMTRFFSVFFFSFSVFFSFLCFFLFLCFVLFFILNFYLFFGGNGKDRGQRQGDGKINGTGIPDAKVTKNQ